MSYFAGGIGTNEETRLCDPPNMRIAFTRSFKTVTGVDRTYAKMQTIYVVARADHFKLYKKNWGSYAWQLDSVDPA
jgi:hypothetical protein